MVPNSLTSRWTSFRVGRRRGLTSSGSVIRPLQQIPEKVDAGPASSGHPLKKLVTVYSKVMISIVYKLIYSFLKIYWFILRPRTQGVICLILSGDELLLIRHTYGRTAWTLSGGGLKSNETKEEAVKREVKEELGLNITPEYIGEFTHNPEHKIDTVFCFVARMEKIEPKIDHLEIKEAKWWNINNLPRDHSMSLKRVLLMHKSR